MVFVIAPLAVMAICAYGTFPYSVSRVKLFAKAATMWEWEGSSRTTGRHFLVVVLGCRKPSKTVVAGVFYRCGESYSPGAHDFWSVMVRNKGAMIEIWVEA